MTMDLEPRYSHMSPNSIGDRVGEHVRKQMFRMFLEQFDPDATTKILDMGVTSDRTYLSSNYFEAWYPYRRNITAAGIDDAAFIEDLYPGVTFVRANALDMPFRDGSFDLVHSSAVLEHVGSFDHQKKMVMECLRVARRGVCLTTPNRWFPIEFHTQLPLVHWLPKPVSRSAMRRLGYGWFALEENLNLLTRSELGRIVERISGWSFQIVPAKLMGLTSNLLLFGHRKERVDCYPNATSG